MTIHMGSSMVVLAAVLGIGLPITAVATSQQVAEPAMVRAVGNAGGDQALVRQRLTQVDQAARLKRQVQRQTMVHQSKPSPVGNRLGTVLKQTSRE
ncbi:hypothetical protein [Lactiplantibacillus daowaiensis]|uniref:Uncharacterized protein n=1 Tax=Lactiplantibacillus daowaiensis TaxID=2559918 RepID=A0ABW1S382_9LACO|nr:hypothetical protein [Lactiplantibacillus daowaiensis]